MNTVKYIKSFSKGQITIPKDFRDIFGIQGEFWLKLWIEEGKIVAEPIEKKNNKTAWRKRLLQMPQLTIDVTEIQKNREQVEKQVAKRAV